MLDSHSTLSSTLGKFLLMEAGPGDPGSIIVRFEIHSEIIPGTSCIFAVPAYTGIPVPHRKSGSSFGVYSTNRRGGLSFTDVQWRHILHKPDTIIFLIGKAKCLDHTLIDVTKESQYAAK